MEMRPIVVSYRRRVQVEFKLCHKNNEDDDGKLKTGDRSRSDRPNFHFFVAETEDWRSPKFSQQLPQTVQKKEKMLL